MMNTNAVNFFKANTHDFIPENRELILAVWQVINPGNIGQIIRLGHNVGASRVLFVHDDPQFRASKIKKSAGFSFDQMKWEFISQADFYTLLKQDFKLLVLETCNNSKNIYDEELPKKTIFLAGSESYGIPHEVIDKSDLAVFIPMPGACKSMNVSQAMSVAAFEWYRQNRE